MLISADFRLSGAIFLLPLSFSGVPFLTFVGGSDYTNNNGLTWIRKSIERYLAGGLRDKSQQLL